MNETSPRPYTRHNLIQGTLGTLAGFPTRVAKEGGVEDITQDHHRWVQGENLAALYEKFDHPLYKTKLIHQKLGSRWHGWNHDAPYRTMLTTRPAFRPKCV